MSDRVEEIPLNKIRWTTQPIRPVNVDHVRNLCKSLRIHGQLQEILVKPPNSEGIYEGVIGLQRFEAAKLAGLPTVRCRIHAFKSRDEERFAQLAENLHRLDLTAIERAEAYRELAEYYRNEMPEDSDKAIIKAIATGIEEQTGRKPPSEKTIHHYLQLSKELPQEVKQNLTGETGKNFGVRHGLELLRLKDKPHEQKCLIEKFIEASIQGRPPTVRKWKQEVDAIVRPKGEPSPPVVSRDITFECPYCGAEYHPYYQGEEDEPHRHGLKRIYRDAEGREIEKQPSLNYRCLDCYSSFPTPVKATFEGVTRRSCPNCGSPNIKRLR
ncbi:MAG: ParB/RepB/Spo0J family partition protein [Candidatus Bathyarchaeia archaeon]